MKRLFVAALVLFATSSSAWDGGTWYGGGSSEDGGGAPDAHAASHEDGGADEIGVGGLLGLLVTQQTPVNHDHTGDAGDGGQLNATSVFSAGTVPTARLGSGTANSTTFLRGDQTWAAAGGGSVTGGACDPGEYATEVGSDGAPTCAQPQFSELGGAATDAQIPNDITVDAATSATTATTASAGDSATAFFPGGTLESARLPAATEAVQGACELSTSAETAAGLCVQASDTRLSDARTPTNHDHTGDVGDGGQLAISTATTGDLELGSRTSGNYAASSSEGGPATSVAANSVALGTDTTGGYAASATEGGSATSVAANSVALTTDTTGNYAAGDGEAGAATSGDSATAFFGAGQIESARGGTGADLSAAASGRYPKANGSGAFAASTLSAAGTGSCTNQAATALNADAAPTCSTVSTAMVSAALKTDTRCFTIGSATAGSPALVDGDDQPTIWSNRTGGGVTLTEVCCEHNSGTAPIVQLQKDDGSPTDMLSTNLTCNTSLASGCTTSFVSGENAMANATNLDFKMVTAGGAATSVSVCRTYTTD